MKQVYDPYAENAVIASVICDDSVAQEALSILTENDFFEGAHKIIFEAIKLMHALKKKIDVSTLCSFLRKEQKLESVGGSANIAKFVSGNIESKNIIHYANIVKTYSLLREIRKRSQFISENPESDKRKKWIDEINNFERAIPGDLSSLKTFKDVMDDTIKDLDRDPFEYGLAGYPTGFWKIDKYVSGIEQGKYYILAARPSVGKTALVLNIALNIVKRNIPVIFFSYETKNESLGKRILASELQIDGNRLRSRTLYDDERKEIIMWKEKNEETPFYFVDEHETELAQLEKIVSEVQRKHKEFIVIVDYLQLIPGGQGDTREQRVADISRTLRSLTLLYDIPVIALSQLNRGITYRSKDSKPRVEDLRESGAQEQDADTVIFLHRSEEAIGEGLQPIKIIIAKQRDGALAEFDLLFNPSNVRFLND